MSVVYPVGLEAVRPGTTDLISPHSVVSFLVRTILVLIYE